MRLQVQTSIVDEEVSVIVCMMMPRLTLTPSVLSLSLVSVDS
jgi:hypothetical protein